MGFADNMRILSNINCALASTNTYLDQKANGVTTPRASANLVGNILNGFARNDIAYQMQMRGNPVGNTINLYAGYGNPQANAIGTFGLMRACSPWMFFNSYSCCPWMMAPPPPPMPGTFASFGMGFNMGYPFGRMGGYFC